MRVLRKRSSGVPSAPTSVGFSTYRVGNVPSPRSSKQSLPCLDSGSPLSTIASNSPPYYIIAVGKKFTVTYLCLWGSMVRPLGSTSNAKPSDLLCPLGLTSNLTVQGILLGFIILNFSLAPSGFLEATRVPNQKTFSWTEKRLELMTVCVLIEGSREGITVYSSKIYSTSLVLIPGWEDSAMSWNGIPSGMIVGSLLATSRARVLS